MYGTIQLSKAPGSSPELQQLRGQREKPFRIQHHGVVEYMPKQAPAFPKLLPRPVMPGTYTTQDAIFMSSNCIHWEAGTPAYCKNAVSDQSEQLLGGKSLHGTQTLREPSKTDLTSCIPVVRLDREPTPSNTPGVSEAPEGYIPVCDPRPAGTLEIQSTSS